MESDDRRQLDCAEAICDWFWEQDAAGHVIYLSPGFEPRSNLDPDTLIGRGLHEIFKPPAEDGQTLVGLLQAREAFRDLVLHYQDRSGRRRWIRLSGQPGLDAAGGYRGAAVTTTSGESADAVYRRLFESSITPILIYDRDTLEILAVNDAGLAQYGYSREVFLELTLADLHPREAMASLFADDGPDPTEPHAERHLNSDGAVIQVDAEAHALTYAGRPAMALLARDVTEARKASEAMRKSEARYRTLYEQSPTMLFTVDQRGRIRTVNRKAASRLGHRAGELIGRPVTLLYPEPERTRVSGHMAICLRQPGSVRSWEAWKLTAQGEQIRVRETARSIRAQDGRLSALCFSEDITDAYTRSTELAFQASHDGLTGLLNRREFLNRLERVLPERGGESKHAMCYLDLDRFKPINDSCGHAAGDACLQQLGELLRGRVRSRDSVARLGGDEFGILMEHCDLEAAERVARGLLDAIETFQFYWDDKCFSVGVSIGVATLTPGPITAADALSVVDGACYSAKRQGGRRVQVVQLSDAWVADSEPQTAADSAWTVRIQRALDERRFCLYAQVIRPVNTDSSESAEIHELLLRLREDGELITPAAFLPAAERSRLGLSLDRWVMETALNHLAAHTPLQSRPGAVSLNLSAQSILDADFAAFVLAGLDGYGIPGSCLCFEIPEAVVLTDLPGVGRFVEALEHTGSRFALDGFGGGMASFQHLKHLPVDLVKIDGRQVKGIVDDPVGLAMVQSINQITHALGKKTVAGFVENDAISNEVRRIGVDYVQGYGIGMPAPLPP